MHSLMITIFFPGFCISASLEDRGLMIIPYQQSIQQRKAEKGG